MCIKYMCILLTDLCLVCSTVTGLIGSVHYLMDTCILWEMIFDIISLV